MTTISPLAGFFSIPAKAYEHFTLTYSAARTLSTIILAICAGVILAALYNFYMRRVPGGVVRLLLSRGALSPETALSAEELGLLDKPFSLWELLRGVSLRHILCAVRDDEAKNDGEVDAQTRFYIPEDKKYRVEVRFAQKGNGVKALILSCALTLVLGFLLIKLIPVVLTIADNFM
jgi:hypothetical protein